MLVSHKGKIWRVTKKGFRKLMFRIASEKPYDITDFGKDVGTLTVDADLDTIDSAAALKVLDKVI